MDRRPLPRAPDSGHYEAASDAGGERAAAMYSILQTAKLIGINPEAYLTDTLVKIADGHPINRIAELMPWAYQPAV